MSIDLHHGDFKDILPSLDKGSVDMFFCDLPYNKTACSWDKENIPLDALWAILRRLGHKHTVYIFTASQPFTTLLGVSQTKLLKYSLVWEKQQGTNPLLAKKRPMNVHEDILVFYDKLPVYNPQMEEGSPYKGYSSNDKKIGEVYGSLNSIHKENSGTRYPRSVLRFNNVRRAYHPTQKPVDLLIYLIKTYTDESMTVLDPTMGVGSTAVACKLTNRNFIGCEINEEYYNIAVKRVSDAKSI